MLRRSILLAVSLAPVIAASSALAQTDSWPTRPIRMIVAYPPGGSTDVAGRILAAQLGTRLGQQVVIENRPGAGGTVGAMSVVRADPDGYTVLLGASAEVSIAPVTRKALPFDPLKDLQPVALVGQVPFVLVTNPRLPVTTLEELIAYANANPNKLNYSSFGNNTSNHLAGELFKSIAHISAVHVPYKGSGPSIADLIGGQVQYTFDTPPAVLGQVKAGKLRAIAVATMQRLPTAPNVPTFAEAGLPGFVAGTWFGLLVPAKTPRAIIDRLNAATDAVLASAELRKAYADQGIVPGSGSPEDFGRFIEAEIGKWKDLAPKAGIVAE